MRTRLRAAERRTQLLEVAGNLFAEHGYHGLSMESLAEAAGVSKPVLYQHFPSKRDLYLGLVADAVEEMEARVRDALEGTTDNKARITGAVSAYFDFVEDSRFGLLFTTAELADEAVRDAVEGAFNRVASQIAGLIAADAGLDDDAALFLAASLRGLASEAARWWVERGTMPKAEAVHLVSRLAWRGLGAFDAGTPVKGAGQDRAPAPPA
ncbi:MAG: TetR/AcrR family transcriptional regulator [Actinomycetota bacterium]